MSMPAAAVPGATASHPLEERRALRASSTTQWRSAAACCDHPERAARLSGDRLGAQVQRVRHQQQSPPALVGSHGVGTSLQEGRSGQRAAARRCGSAAGRPTPSGRRCRWPSAARCPASRTWRCLRSRRAVPAAGSVRSRRPQGAETPPAPGPGVRLRKPGTDADHRHGGLEHDAVRPLMRVSCARRGHGHPACRSARRRGRRPGPSRSRRHRDDATPLRVPSPAPAAAPGRPALRRARRLVDLRALDAIERQAQAAPAVRAGSARSSRGSARVRSCGDCSIRVLSGPAATLPA
jgi:hypothetical protein